MGFQFGFGLEVAGRKGSCGSSNKLNFIDLTQVPMLTLASS
jgi:hypothetical protein